jgi:hypothetical protein
VSNAWQDSVQVYDDKNAVFEEENDDEELDADLVRK